MAELDLYWFLALLFSPIAVCVILLLSNWKSPSWTPWFAAIGTSLVLGISLGVTSQFKYDTVDQLGILDDDEFRSKSSLFSRAKNSDFNPDYEVKSSFDWVARVRWVPKFGIQFYLGMDGLNLGCIIIANFSFFLATLMVWLKEKISSVQFPFVSLAQFGLTGTFLALDGFFLMFFLSIFLIAGYFLGLGIVPFSKRKYSSLAAQLSAVSFVLIGSVILFSVQANMAGFTNPDEMIATTSHMKRLHPNWDEKKTSEVLSSHSWNIMAFQRAGIGAILGNILKTSAEGKGSPWLTKKSQIMCFLVIAVACLGLVISSFLVLLSLKFAETDSVFSAVPCCMMYGLTGIYLFARIGVGVFPLGATLASPILFWVFMGLAGLAVAYLAISKSVWNLPAQFYLWSQMTILMGLTAVLSLSADFWNSKMFSGILLGEISLCVSVPLIVFLFLKIQTTLKLDVFDIPLGLWKTQPIFVLAIGFTFILALGVPGSFGFLGGYSVFGAIISFGGVLPFAALMVLFLLVIRRIINAMELLGTGSPLSGTQITFSLPECIGILASFILLIAPGFFQNLVLSWYYPSTCAIYDLVQFAFLK